jgi:hypothetical protein
MSEKTLRKFLDRLHSDKQFRESLRDEKHWASAVGELHLSPAELAAISMQDEDALRRLAGSEVKIAGENLGFYTTNLICSLLCFCWPFSNTRINIDTPNSRRHCGTGGGETWCCPQPD